jgi:hypothetical protein
MLGLAWLPTRNRHFQFGFESESAPMGGLARVQRRSGPRPPRPAESSWCQRARVAAADTESDSDSDAESRAAAGGVRVRNLNLT